MKKKFIVFIAFILLVSSLLSASSEIYPLTSDLYTNMDLLYQLTGLSAPSGARPWSTQEAKIILAKIDKTKLGNNSLWLYEETENIINESLKISLDDKAYFDVGVAFNAEAYYHTNDEDYRTDLDWNYNFVERKPLAKISLEFGITDALYIYTDMHYNRGRYNFFDEARELKDLFEGYAVADKTGGGVAAVIPPLDDASAKGWMHLSLLNYTNSFMTNFLLPFYDIDSTWPQRSVFAYLNDNFSISLSKDKVKWGNGVTGNFIVDDYTEFNDYLRASAFTKNFKYDFMLLFFNTKWTHRDSLPDTPIKVLMAHRLEFRILDKVTLAVSENLAYQDSSFNLSFLNPAYIYHNLNDRSKFNAIAHLELDFVLPFGFRGYLQYVMDQAQAPGEGGDQADASGYMVGINYSKAFENRSILSLNAEFVLTTPALYRRDKVDFINLRQNYNNGQNDRHSNVTRPEYIGYQYGGDALVFQFDADYKLPSLGNIYGSFFFMKHGKMNIYQSHNVNGINSDFPNYQGTTPSGKEDEIETTYRITLGSEINIPLPTKVVNMTAWAQLDYYMVHNKSMFNLDGVSTNDNIIVNKKGWSNDFQFSFGVGISY